jgi:hypothetical protein
MAGAVEEVRRRVEERAESIYKDADALERYCAVHGPIEATGCFGPSLADCLSKVASVSIPNSWRWMVVDDITGGAHLLITGIGHPE